MAFLCYDTRVTRDLIHIRKGTLPDLSQIQEFTQNTFSWGDYLPKAWNDWVRSKRGDLLVAEIERKVVGTIHVRYLENYEAWLEGVRVRHEFRKRGVAGAMIQAAHERAKKKKCRIIRLETGVDNHAAQRAFEKFGYRAIVEYAEFKAKTGQGEMTARLATADDVSACWSLWDSSWLKRASKAIVPAVYGWRWWEYTRARLMNDILGERVWMMRRAFLVLREMDRESLDILVLVGAKRDAMKLLSDVKWIAARKKKQDVYWLAPHSPRAETWASEARYKLDETGLVIYACEL